MDETTHLRIVGEVAKPRLAGYGITFRSRYAVHEDPQYNTGEFFEFRASKEEGMGLVEFVQIIHRQELARLGGRQFADDFCVKVRRALGVF